jgi:hypothetical protein
MAATSPGCVLYPLKQAQNGLFGGFAAVSIHILCENGAICQSKKNIPPALWGRSLGIFLIEKIVGTA